jgi:hypothetical protein
MAVGYLPPPLAIFASDASSLLKAPNLVALFSCRLYWCVIFLLLLLVWHTLWVLLMGDSLKLSSSIMFYVRYQSSLCPLYCPPSTVGPFLTSPPR